MRHSRRTTNLLDAVRGLTWPADAQEPPSSKTTSPRHGNPDTYPGNLCRRCDRTSGSPFIYKVAGISIPAGVPYSVFGCRSSNARTPSAALLPAAAVGGFRCYEGMRTTLMTLRIA